MITAQGSDSAFLDIITVQMTRQESCSNCEAGQHQDEQGQTSCKIARLKKKQSLNVIVMHKLLHWNVHRVSTIHTMLCVQ